MARAVEKGPGRPAWMLVVVLGMVVGVVRAGVGVWMDDGNGRTVLADELDSEEAAELARDILDVMDLPSPPATPPGAHPHRHHHTSRAHHSHGSAPTWLKSVYDTIDEFGHASSPQLDASHRETVTKADTIITFVNRDPPGGRLHHGANKHLYFDMKDVPLDHSLLGAEIQVHQGPQTEEALVLHVYMLTSADGSEEREVARVGLSAPGWTSINVTTPVLSWLLLPETNHGLRLAVTSRHRKHELRFNEVGMSGARDHQDHRPFLVGFFALPAAAHHHLPSHIRRVRRSAATTTHRAFHSSRPRNYRDVSLKADTSCRMKHLHVSFSDLGWQNWVIAPEGYDANYCEGLCDFPPHPKMNHSNHALVQNLVKVIKGVPEGHELPPTACCAPIDLATIPVLYYSYENNIVLKKYPKMIVKSCGCL